MESMPFIHCNKLFNIFFEDDLAFVEVRKILDYLMDMDALNCAGSEVNTTAFELEIGNLNFKVWAIDNDVYIQKNG